MTKINKIISGVLVIAILSGFYMPVFAVEETDAPVSSITINLNSMARASSGETFESAEVKAFFSENDLDYDYYRAWLYSNEMDGLESVTITVMPSEETALPASTVANSQVQDSRLVYADRVYVYAPKTNPFTPGQLMKNAISQAFTFVIGKYSRRVASLATLFGITNPDLYFGTDKVRENKEYTINDGASRVVTKFVELYAPVSGQIKWYAWGLAESDYVRHGAQLYYKGIAHGPTVNNYEQYYTEHYYSHPTLINLVKEAYSNGRTYNEVADEYVAATGGYALNKRDINEYRYLEYDNLCG